MFNFGNKYSCMTFKIVAELYTAICLRDNSHMTSFIYFAVTFYMSDGRENEEPPLNFWGRYLR
jgi:hypothetical protein